MFPSEAEMAAWAAERDSDRARRTAEGHFNPTNLGHWIDLCFTAGVPFVAAEKIVSIPIRDLWDGLDAEDKSYRDGSQPPENILQFGEVMRAAMSARPNHMVRWACCGTGTLKSRLSHGEYEFSPELGELDHLLSDPRAFDIISEYPEAVIDVFARPWMKAKIIDSYPVEYRVYVDHDRIVGISNYYPQRDLPNNSDTLNDIWQSLDYADAFIQAMQKPMNWPQIEKNWDISKLSCSIDFMRLDDGPLLFLEGGPPYSPSGGSHPCCFDGSPNGIAFAATQAWKEAMGVGLMPRVVYPVAAEIAPGDPAGYRILKGENVA